MKSILSTCALAALTLLPTATLAQNWEKGYVLEDSVRWTWGNAMKNAIKPATVTKKNTWSSSVPNDCAVEALKPVSASNPERQCNLDQLVVQEIWWSDSPTPWVVCKCKDTQFSDNQLFDELGRIPVGFRQFVRYFMAFKAKTGSRTGYATWNKDVVITNLNPMNVFHEVGHQVGLFFLTDNGGRHATTLFRNAVNKDTCWTTWYARVSGESEAHEAFGRWGHLLEPFGEAFWLRQYHKAIGKYAPYNFACAADQLDAVDTLVDGFLRAGYTSNNLIPYGPNSNRQTLMNNLGAGGSGVPGGFPNNGGLPDLSDYNYEDTLRRFNLTENPGVGSNETYVP